MLLAAAGSLTFLSAGASTLAQSNESFKVGERVEANIASVGGGIRIAYKQGWRKATITRIFEAKNVSGGGQKDPVTVALADAIASQGTNRVIEATRLAQVDIAYTKSDSLAVKAITVTRPPGPDSLTGKDLIIGITVIVTDKRYILYTRALGKSIYGGAEAVVVDETGKIVGGQYDWDEPRRDVGTNWGISVEGAQSITTNDREHWANVLIPDKVKTDGIGMWQHEVSYLVKIDDGREYVLLAQKIRRLTEPRNN